MSLSLSLSLFIWELPVVPLLVVVFAGEGVTVAVDMRPGLFMLVLGASGVADADERGDIAEISHASASSAAAAGASRVL